MQCLPMKPIRCYTCNKILGNKWTVVDELLGSGLSLKEVYGRIGVSRYCCQRIIMTSVEDRVPPVPVESNVNIVVRTGSHGPTFRHVV